VVDPNSSESSNSSSGSTDDTGMLMDSTRAVMTMKTIPDIPLCRKPKQKRRKMKKPRRPSAFWADIGNMEKELRLFWKSVHVPIDDSLPPPIPNEALLNHFERHDLRYAIAHMGGRGCVAERLGGATLIPGKWFEACQNSKEVQCLLKPGNPAGVGLSRKVPPIAPYVKRSLFKVVRRKVKQGQNSVVVAVADDVDVVVAAGDDDVIASDEDHEEDRKEDHEEESYSTAVMEEDSCLDFESQFPEEIQQVYSYRFQAGERWAHQSSRNPRGYWDEAVVIQEL
jgi:hypothetical protein